MGLVGGHTQTETDPFSTGHHASYQMHNKSIILYIQTTDQNGEETQMMAHQFHAKLMGFVLGMRARRQGEAAPPVRGELLLLQLGVQATRECYLEI